MTSNKTIAEVTEPQIDWALIGNRGLDEGVQCFEAKQARLETLGGDLYLALGYTAGGPYQQLDDRRIGNWEKFVVNVSPKDGKLSTVIRYDCDSSLAYADFSRSLFFEVNGPRRWRGGVVIEVVHTRPSGGQVRVVFMAAASGDFGIVDEAVARAAANEAAFQWLRQQKAFDEAKAVAAS